MRGGDLCFQETAAIYRHDPSRPTHGNHLIFLCTAFQKYVHLYDKNVSSARQVTRDVSIRFFKKSPKLF